MKRDSNFSQQFLMSFQYNWHVRSSWLKWCESVSVSELKKPRIGGYGSILETLLHVIDVENSWINAIKGEADIPLIIQDHNTLASVMEVSAQSIQMVSAFIQSEMPQIEMEKEVTVSWDDGRYCVEGILHHIIFHSIHHMGQLSIWARQMNRNPVDASYLSTRAEFDVT